MENSAAGHIQMYEIDIAGYAEQQENLVVLRPLFLLWACRHSGF